jgi:hypothetical protein
VDFAQIRTLEKLLIAAIGALSIYLGYRLFCDVPVRGTGTVGIGRMRVPTPLAAGALLALVGLGLVATEARSFVRSGVYVSPYDFAAGDGSVAHPGAIRRGSHEIFTPSDKPVSPLRDRGKFRQQMA